MTFHPRAPASLMAQDKQPRLRRLIIAFQPFSAHRARTRISRSDPNCLLRVPSRILASGLELGGSIRSILLRDDAAVLGRLSSSSELDIRSGGILVASIPNDDESEDMRESEGMSGDCGGANPLHSQLPGIGEVCWR